MLKQIHSDRIVEADGSPGVIGEGDALIGGRPGVLVGVRTADCVPILMVDTRRRAVAAVHAGWRGSSAAIARKCVELLEQRYGSDPADVQAAIGPAIGACCYQVGPEVAQRFAGWFPQFAGVDRPVNIDLAAVNRKQLEEAGVPARQIHGGAPCTFCAAELHSYRRDGPHAGRLISAIGIRR
jgi:YfiH family protein